MPFPPITLITVHSLPAYPEYASVEIYKDGWKNSWGTNYDWAGSRFKCALASPVDLSGVSQFEFDIYIEDNEAFQTAAEAGGLVFVVGSGDNEYKQRSGYSFAEQVTQNGWNHIVIDKNSAVNRARG